jgi:hypothetical protein
MVKSLIALSQVLLQDMGQWCGVDTLRDWKTIARRTEHEGSSFLTITLPAFAKDFDQSLADGYVGDNRFVSFSRTGGLPRFLGGFLRLVFSSGSGVLLDSPDVMAIRAIRQFCMAFGKLNLPCSEKRVNAAMMGYVKCDEELAAISFSERDLSLFVETAWTLFSGVLTALERELYEGELVPRHGPGATADKLVGNRKYTQSEWPVRLEPYMPAGEYIIPSWRYWRELQDVTFLEPKDERPVKVTAVPKTQKTPRLIAIEPTCMQYAQQALGIRLAQLLESDSVTRHLLGFTNQIPNQDMACEGSVTGSLATLDLSEASDRVSNRLVEALFSRTPFLKGAVMGCRSRVADVQGHGKVTLSKFASMGSALCFPVEAMVFLTIICLTMADSQGHRFTSEGGKLLRGRVRVYGDDIIVPVTMAREVTDRLETYGLKVNRSKSFWTGRFRESCGGDFFSGHRVTPVRVKSGIPTSLRFAHDVSATVSLRNQLYERGAYLTAQHLDRILKRLLVVYPEIPLGHTALGRWTLGPVRPQRICPDLQRPLVRVGVLDSPLPLSPLEGYGALEKFFIERGVIPLGVKSFERAGRPSVVHIKLRWTPLDMSGVGA